MGRKFLLIFLIYFVIIFQYAVNFKIQNTFGCLAAQSVDVLNQDTSINPSNTLLSGSSFNIIGSVKNMGTVTINNSSVNGYKSSGWGTTLVICPIIGSSTNSLSVHDSAFTSIYIDLLNGYNIFDKMQSDNIHIVNPSQENIYTEFNNDDFEDYELQIINLTGEKSKIC